MAENARKHTVPDGGDMSVSRETIFMTALQSIGDIIPVDDNTDRDQVVSDLSAEGVGPSASRPLVTLRADARGLHRIEYSYNGVIWLPASGVLEFSSTSARNTWTTSYSGLLTAGDRCMVAGVEYSWSGTAWYQVIVAPNFIARNAPSGVASSGTLSTITGLSVVVDNGTFTYSTGVFTCQVAGRYNLKLIVGWAPSNTGLRTSRLVVAGSTSVTRSAQGTISASVDTSAISEIVGINLAAGDTITILQQQSSGGALSMSPEVILERVA